MTYIELLHKYKLKNQITYTSIINYSNDLISYNKF